MNTDVPIPILNMSSKETMTPLLDALSNSNFELAKTLSPENTKLLGYEIISEPTEIMQYGSYAADYRYTEVPPGIYPIFAVEYAYDDAKEMYTNIVKSFNGLRFWKEGTITKHSSPDYDSMRIKHNVVLESPYAFSVAKTVHENPDSRIRLLPPFRAEKLYFSDTDGELAFTYQIRDISLPDFIKENPMSLCKDKKQLDSVIKATKNRPKTDHVSRKSSKNINIAK